ncbi:MAG TPA: hypothetical protein PKK15_16990, partial [Kouleothrix sp.]|nr:hypothetical protein [Kouleothrix sp.]
IVALLATAALAPAAPVAVGVAMMDAAEARETLDAMRQDLGQAEISLGSFRQRALEFAELGEQYSKSYVSRLLNAAKIERLLELPVGNSEVPERTLRPLGQLDTPEQQRQAWQVASTAAGGATPTAGQVQAAVDARKAEQLAQADAQHLQAIEKIIATLDQWADSARPAQIQEAYSHAREIRDTALHARAFATIDRALDNTAAPAPEQRGQPKAPVPEQLPWPLPKELADRATRTGLLVYKETRSYRTMNAKGAANYAYHKSVGELEGYIRSQEIRSYADQQAKREPPAAAPVVSLPADFADAQRRARAIGLNLAMNMYGKFSCKNERGSGVDQYDWPDMLQHLVYAERSHAEREAERARRQQPAAALTAVPDMVQPAIGVRRPQRPASADVSATLRYLDQIESYADQQEQRVAELERRLAAPIRWIRVQLATCRLRIADGTADDITAAELETLADELEQLVSDGSVAVDIAESLARQIGEAQQDLRGKVKSA